MASHKLTWFRSRPAPSLGGQGFHWRTMRGSLGAKACPCPGPDKAGETAFLPAEGERGPLSSHTEPLASAAHCGLGAGGPGPQRGSAGCPHSVLSPWGWSPSGSWTSRCLVGVATGLQILGNPWRPSWATSSACGVGGGSAGPHHREQGVPLGTSQGRQWSATGCPGYEGMGYWWLWLQ